MKTFKLMLPFLSTFILMAFASFAQTNNKIYASLEDYKNNKPIEGYEIVDGSWTFVVGKESVKVTVGEKADSKNLSNLPGEFYTYRNMLNRVYKGQAYVVLVTGSLCFYAQYGDASNLYYSETISGKLESHSTKEFKKLLKAQGLLEAYEKEEPKRSKSESYTEYNGRYISWIAKYYSLLNEKSGS